MSYTIMSVDDFKACNIIMRKLLSLVSINVTLNDFTCPVEAFHTIEKINPDLIFLDLNMPELDGWEFLGKMAQNNIDTRVIVLTSSASKSDTDRCAQFANVIDYQVKPITKNRLEALLTQHLLNDKTELAT